MVRTREELEEQSAILDCMINVLEEERREKKKELIEEE